MLAELDTRWSAILLFAALFASALGEHVAGEEEAKTAPCSCPRAFKPVCGTDAQTYNSDCKLQCAQQNNPGSSRNTSFLQFITVCFSGLRMAYQGICCPEPFCPGHWDPLCDDHGANKRVARPLPLISRLFLLFRPHARERMHVPLCVMRYAQDGQLGAANRVLRRVQAGLVRRRLSQALRSRLRHVRSHSREYVLVRQRQLSQASARRATAARRLQRRLR